MFRVTLILVVSVTPSQCHSGKKYLKSEIFILFNLILFAIMKSGESHFLLIFEVIFERIFYIQILMIVLLAPMYHLD